MSLVFMMVRIILIVLCLQTVLNDVSAVDTWKYWWQNRLIYQLYPWSFKDSNGDGYGDINGTIDSLDYLSDIGVEVILMSEMFESASKDFYAVTNFMDIDPLLGTLAEFRELKAQMNNRDMKLVIELDPNHSSNEHHWFNESVNVFNDYYVWRGGLFNRNNTLEPPNNWVNNTGDSAWEPIPMTNRYYLHQFGVNQPDFNYRSTSLIREMENIIIFWLQQNVDGIYIKNAAYLFEDIDFMDEIDNHDRTQHQKETYDLIRSWRILLNDHTNGYLRLMIVEANENVDQSLQYYGTEDEPRAHIVMNLHLITDFNVNSTASDFNKIVKDMMERNSSGIWPNWLTGNLDNTRVATRLGSKMIDGMNMLNLLLPGTAFTYYGEEIGMEDYRGGKLVEYPQRTPFLWNNSTNAGFSTNTSTLQINENFLEVNLQKQNETAKSHYNVYKKIAAIRKKLQEEDTSFTHFKEDGIFVFIRILSTNEYYIVAVNFGETDETIDLQDECEKLPDILEVYTSSIDSEKVEGENFTSNKIVLAGKEAVVFTGRLQPTTTTTTTTKTTTAESCACTESPGKGSQAYGGIFILLATSGLALSVQSAI